MIEVGEYVRTKDGKILKIDGFEKDLRNIEVVCFTTGEVYTREKLNEIIKNHSKNIIDLIEVGDYVNGVKVIEVGKYNFKTVEEYGLKIHHKKSVKIKSIVTHEQFEAMKYKVEE